MRDPGDTEDPRSSPRNVRRGGEPRAKRQTRERSPGIVVRLAPKRLVDLHAKPGTVLLDRVFNHRLRRFEDPEDSAEIGFDMELKEASSPAGSEPVAALVAATFDAATTPALRRRLRHGQALCVVVQVPTPAWAEPVSTHYRAAFGERWIQRVNYGAGQTEFQDRSGSNAVSLALSAGQSVVGISADANLLPRTLVGAADLVLALAPPNAAVVKAAIARVAGWAPVTLEDSTVAGLDLDDIVAALRPGTGSQRIVQRLASAAAALRASRNLKQEDK